MEISEMTQETTAKRGKELLAHVDVQTKRCQTLRDHLYGVKRLAEKNCPVDYLKHMAMAVALLHDAGKASKDFSAYLQEVLSSKKAEKKTIDHSSVGGFLVEGLMKRGLACEMISTAIYSHHGLQDCIDVECGETLSEKRRRRWKEEDIQEVKQRYFEIVNEDEVRELLKKAKKDAANMKGQIEREIPYIGTGNNARKIYGEKSFYIGMFERLLLSVLIDCDWLDTASFFHEEAVREQPKKEELAKMWKQAINHLEEYRKTLSAKKSVLNGYREEIAEQCRKAADAKTGLYRLNVPTGAGKTLSSLRFALYHAHKHQKRRIIYVSSFLSVLEQNAQELRSALGDAIYVLEHHSNICPADEEEASAYQRLTERWDHPVIATTAVQMLNTLFSVQKTYIRRMSSLCDSVILMDEVQALPTHIMELFYLAINFLTKFCNTTVVLCSATQPSLAKLPENNPFPCEEMVKTCYEEAFRRTEIEDKTQLLDYAMRIEDIKTFVWNKLKEASSVLVVVNTKKCAREIYQALRESCEEECELFHLSTNLCPQNRSDELKEMKQALAEKKRVVCVSTQLIEAGVDISFGCVIRSLAGLDSIIQAAGRCNRHKEAATGKVYIVQLDESIENKSRMKTIRASCEATKKLLYAYQHCPQAYGGSLDTQQAIKKYYEEYLKPSNERFRPTEYPVKEGNTTLAKLLGSNCLAQKRLYSARLEKMKNLPHIIERDDEKKDAHLVQMKNLNQAFQTAGKEFEVISEQEKVTIVIPYDDTARSCIDLLKKEISLSKQKEALRVLQRYTVGISQQEANALGTALEKLPGSEVLIISEDYYDKKEGVLEAPRQKELIM